MGSDGVARTRRIREWAELLMTPMGDEGRAIFGAIRVLVGWPFYGHSCGSFFVGRRGLGICCIASSRLFLCGPLHLISFLIY